MDGKAHVTRFGACFAKDLNVCITFGARLTLAKALAPKALFWITAKQIKGLEIFGKDALSGNLPYLIVNDALSAPQPQMRLNAGIMDRGANEAT